MKVLGNILLTIIFTPLIIVAMIIVSPIFGVYIGLKSLWRTIWNKNATIGVF
jgi:hypothetical protein